VQLHGGLRPAAAVIDGASDLFFELWARSSPPRRSAVGHAALPRGIAVEINGEFELEK